MSKELETNLTSGPKAFTHVVNPTNLKKRFDLLSASLMGTCLLGILAWYSIRYYELFVPFLGGGLRLFKYFVICVTIIYVMKVFIQTSSSFSWWYKSTLYFFRLFVNPLRNQKIKYYYYYFTDYINWIIYYPAKTYYLARFIANVVFFLLIILPIMAFIAFLIGLLFSMIGEKQDILQEVKETAQPSNGVKSPNILSTLASAAGVSPNMLTKAASAAGVSPNMLTKAASAAGVSPNMLTKAASAAGVSPNMLTKAASAAGVSPNMLTKAASAAGVSPNMLTKAASAAGVSPNMLTKAASAAGVSPNMLTKAASAAGVSPNMLTKAASAAGVSPNMLTKALPLL
jgi:hypothetical protein